MKHKNTLIYILIALFGISIIIPTLTKPSQHVTGYRGSKKNIAIVQLNGPISPKQSALQPNDVDSMIQRILNLQKNPDVDAVILRVNSPGGTVGSSQELFQTILNFKNQSEKPIVASIADIGASGAYYAIMGCDKIFANPGSLVGSIGVKVSNLDLTDITKKIGIGQNLYKSGAYKDILSSWRKPTKKESKIVQDMVDNIHDQFVTSLAQARNLTYKKASTLADGRIFTGSQSVENGLVDKLGGLQSTIEFLKTELDATNGVNIINQHKLPIQQIFDQLKRQLYTDITFF